MVWMIKSCKESTVAAFWSQEYSRVRFHCSQNLADPVSCATKVDLAYPCHLLPSDYIWPTSSISQLQVKDTICSCLFTVHHEPRAVLQQCQPDAKAAESELPHSSPGSSACCIRALGMHGPKHHSNGMQWREHPKDHQSSCLLVKSIFNSTSESSSASNSHWTGHLDIKTLLGLQARWYQAPRECQRHVYTWKSAWYWKRKDSTTPVQNYEEN